MTEIRVELKLKTVTCCACGTPFGIEETLYRNIKSKGDEGRFYCPNGHAQYFPGEPSDERIKRIERELEEAQGNATYWKCEATSVQARLKTTKASLRGTKAALTRTKNRVANGVCPCCNRQFTNLQRHMETQHPEYATEIEHESSLS